MPDPQFMTGRVSPLKPSERRQVEDLPGIGLPASRWRGSQITFGPLGRIVVSLLLLVPLWFFWEVSTFGWPGIVIWCFFVLPWAWRDVWKRVRLRSR